MELAYRGLLSLWSSLYLFDHVNSNTNKFSSFDRYNTTSLKLTIRLLWRTSSPKMSKKRDKSDGDTPKKNQNVLSIHFGEYEKEVFPTTFGELLLYFLLAI